MTGAMTGTAPGTIVIAGANMAGASAAQTLRQSGFAGRLILLGAESLPPYERPPLSKEYLLARVPEEKLLLRPVADYEAQGIELRLGVRAAALDVATHEVLLETLGGERMGFDRLGFDRLLIATGSEPRRLDVPGAELAGIHYLRSQGEARALRTALESAPGARVAVVGAGFIGAEVAAASRTLGHDVTVIEPLAVPMERALGPELGAMLAAVHRKHGVTLRLGDGVAAFRGGERVAEVITTSGASIPCDLAVVGVGVRPCVDWLTSSGLRIADGVEVDRFCQTSVPGIYAAGDVARWPYQPAGDVAPVSVRLEHYDNALRQGEAAARNMLADTFAQATPYAPVPYFWSDQYDLKVQMVGYAPSYDSVIFRGSLENRSLAAFYLSDNRLRAVVLVNRVRDLGPARRLVASGAILDPARLADESIELRQLLSAAGA